MQNTSVVIIGAGQAGLAMSRCLSERSIDHVVLERGQTAQSWRTERWDSLRLLTPNWLTRLPGWRYGGEDPDGFMTAAEVIRFLDDYERAIAAPIFSNTTVRSVQTLVTGFRVVTNDGPWTCRAVVVASGAAGNPHVPTLADRLPGRIEQLTPISYRNPERLGDGPVLVVGASASGVQIADELARSGRSVTIAVGEHVRLPRTYRGSDIHTWMEAIGQLDERYDTVDDITRVRRLPSLQLIGSPERRDIGLNELRRNGVSFVGRLAGITDRMAQFSGSLANVCAAADLKQGRLLDLIDAFIVAGRTDDFDDADRPEPTTLPTPRTEIRLEAFDTVVWATGFRPVYPWLAPDLLDGKGAIRHDGGIMSVPGMYVLGLPFTRRRKSSFIDGVGPDAIELSGHLAAYLDATARPPRRRSAGQERIGMTGGVESFAGLAGNARR